MSIFRSIDDPIVCGYDELGHIASKATSIDVAVAGTGMVKLFIHNPVSGEMAHAYLTTTQSAELRARLEYAEDQEMFNR